MKFTATAGSSSDALVRDLVPHATRMDGDGDPALANLTREVLAAAERYAAATQRPGPSVPVSVVSSPAVRANECVLQGVLRALAVPGLSAAERARLTDLGRAAARNAGMDHLTFSGAAA